jgi:hypothetical protein
MLDSPEGVCAGQAQFEYPATSVPFSSTNGPRRADVTAAEASGRRQPRKKEERQRKEAATGVQMTTTMDPGETLSRPKEVFRCG